MESGALQYKVHYAGWNTRYDEWVRKDRIVSMLDRGKSSTVTHSQGPPPKLKVRPGILIFNFWGVKNI